MKEGDGDVNLAFYLFVNHHWSPSFFNNLSNREKTLIAEFVKQEIKNYNKAMRK